MPDIAATIQLANFPTGYCWTDAQQFADDLVDLLSITIPSSSTFSVGPNAPADTTSVWVRTVSGYLEGIYVYLGGWYRPHPVPPSSAERRIFCGPEADVWAYDGGGGQDPTLTPPTLTTGAMWEVDHNFDFRFPLGCGTGTDYSAPGDPVVVAEGDEGGEERHVLLEAEMAEHTHILAHGGVDTIGTEILIAAGQYLAAHGRGYSSPEALYSLQKPNNVDDVPDVGKVAETGEDTAHNTMPPYRGVYYIKRTARQFVSAS